MARRAQISFLESHNTRLLGQIEETWRQKSRATWVKAGDENSKFFHNFSNHWRITNSIWDLKVNEDLILNKAPKLKQAAINHFQRLFTKLDHNNILQQLNTVQTFPHLLSSEDCGQISREVSLEEVHNVLKGFTKDKSPGPNGFTTKFYLDFFDLFGDEITHAVNESRVKG